jgi:NAD(P)H-hydrate repair Nnr-like enzyme with NAD(P)H-hydrate dehydratase domain
MNAFDAACAGVWIHSEIGEILGSGMIAEDIIDMIPITIKKLIKSKQI